MAKIKALRDFSSTTIGYLTAGDVRDDINPGYARHLEEHGFVEVVTSDRSAGYKTKVEAEKPAPLDSGGASPSGVSAPARRSRKKTPKSSEAGE